MSPSLTSQPGHILIPLPAHGYEATECAVPWQVASDAGHRVTFATPDGAVARCDRSTLTGEGLGLFGLLLRADKPARQAFARMEASAEHLNPIRWDEIDVEDFDAIVVPGGHHQDMRPFLEAPALQRCVAAFMAQDKLTAAICHGALLVARSTAADGRSVLYGRRTATVPGEMETTVWKLLHKRMGHERFGKPYDLTAEEEIGRLLKRPEDLMVDKPGLRKDAPGKESRGLCITDGNYLSSRLPHDSWCFAKTVTEALSARLAARRSVAA